LTEFQTRPNSISKNKYEEETDGLSETNVHHVQDDVATFKRTRADFEVVNYFETPLTKADLRALLKKLGLSAREILRKDEPAAKALGINKMEFSDKELIAFMVKYPDLIQRPIRCAGEPGCVGTPAGEC